MTDIELARLCAAAYQPPVPGVTTVLWNDLRADLLEVGNTITVVARGTQPPSLANWIRDFDALPRWRAGAGWCHRGFIDGAEGMLPSILPHLVGRRTVLTGHSLGGSLAIGMAAELTLGRPPGVQVVQVVTFEAARVGGATLRQALRATPIEGREYVCGNDPVPALPEWYDHVWPLWRIGEELPDPLECHEISRVIAGLEACATASVVAPSLSVASDRQTQPPP
jgi:hypothetical protein